MRFQTSSRRVWLSGAIGALLIGGCVPLLGQSPPPPPPGQVVSMPQPIVQNTGTTIELPANMPVSRRFGFNIKVDTRWINGYGYRPIEVTIYSPKPTTTARTITVELHAGLDSTLSVQQEFEFPAGTNQASTIISVPNYEQGFFVVWWDVWIDGVKDIDLSLGTRSTIRAAVGSNIATSALRILVPGPQAAHKVVISTPTSEVQVLSLVASKFPQRWIDYTCLDIVSLSLTDLVQLAKTNPVAIVAIKRWVRAGGQLWVSDVGEDFESLPEVSLQLGVTAALLPAPVTTPQPVTGDKTAEKDVADAQQPDKTLIEGGWHPVRFRVGRPPGQAQGFTDLRTGRSRWANDQRVIAELERDSRYVQTNDISPPDDSSIDRRWPSDSSQWYIEQTYGLGALRAFRGPNEVATFAQIPAANANVIANNASEMAHLPRSLTSALRSTRQWINRHGVVPDSNNLEFAKLLVPGVGLAPVTEFQVLITLFVLLIGPFNYWILKRNKRLQLLVLTVPLSAGLATAALFCYAILSDGFDTRVRVRSLAMIDQTSGEATCWAHTSYYAGIAPGDGLAMPADTAMYPILSTWSGEDSTTQRAMIWSNDSMLLTRGWLKSRTPTQYLMVRSRKTPHRLDIMAGNGKMQIVNRLGTPIESLLVVDETGTFFNGRKVANNARIALQPISRNDAVKQFVSLVRDNEPELPAALTGSDQDFFGRRGPPSRRYYNRSRGTTGDGQLSDNLANHSISDLAGLNGQPALELPLRSYVAVTKTGAEVDLGIQNAKEEASFHVVVGRW